MLAPGSHGGTRAASPRTVDVSLFGSRPPSRQGAHLMRRRPLDAQTGARRIGNRTLLQVHGSEGRRAWPLGGTTNERTVRFHSCEREFAVRSCSRGAPGGRTRSGKIPARPLIIKSSSSHARRHTRPHTVPGHAPPPHVTHPRDQLSALSRRAPRRRFPHPSRRVSRLRLLPYFRGRRVVACAYPVHVKPHRDADASCCPPSGPQHVAAPADVAGQGALEKDSGTSWGGDGPTAAANHRPLPHTPPERNKEWPVKGVHPGDAAEIPTSSTTG